MDASVANRMRVKRSVRTSQPVRCSLRRSASVTLQYRAFNRTRHPESRSCGTGTWAFGLCAQRVCNPLTQSSWQRNPTLQRSMTPLDAQVADLCSRDDSDFGFANWLCLSIVDAVHFSPAWTPLPIRTERLKPSITTNTETNITN